MPTCYAYTCATNCDGHWSGCRNYGCVDYAPLPATNTVIDTGGVCGSHQVSTICISVSAWSRWTEVSGVDNGSYYSSRVISSSRAYREATSGSEADAQKTNLLLHVEDLRYAINEERRRRVEAGAAVAGTTPVVWATATDLDHNDINAMVTAINQIKANWLTDVNALEDQVVTSYHIDRIRKQIESLRQDCISNKVCAPNTVCSCYCHCNCHYSDRRLKRNIRSI